MCNRWMIRTSPTSLFENGWKNWIESYALIDDENKTGEDTIISEQKMWWKIKLIQQFVRMEK